MRNWDWAWTGASLKLRIGINKTSLAHCIDCILWFFFSPVFFSCWRAFQKIFLIFTGRPGVWKTFYFIFFTHFFPFYLTFLAPAQPVLFRSETSLLLVSGRALAGCFASPSVQSGPACPCRIFAFKVLMSVLPSHSGLFNECLVIFFFFFHW